MPLELNYNSKKFCMKQVEPYLGSYELSCDASLIKKPYTNLSP